MNRPIDQAAYDRALAQVRAAKLFDLDRAFLDAMATVEAAGPGVRRAPMSHDGLADSIAAANVHRLRFED